MKATVEGVEGRRTLRRRERRLLRRVPGRGDRARARATASRCGSRRAPSCATSSRSRKLTKIESEHFTYQVAQDTGNSVLVIANEDYTGVNPDVPAGHDRAEVPRRARRGARGQRRDPATSGMSTRRACRTISACSSHYDSVLWYLGDNRLTQDPEDVLTDTFCSARSRTCRSPSGSSTSRWRCATTSTRAASSRSTARRPRYYGQLGGALGGIYYGLDGAPEQDCVVTADFFSDCLLLADDFTQYWLGAYDRTPVGADGVIGYGRSARRGRGALRRTGDRRQPGRRGRRVRDHERRAAGRRVPAVRELGVAEYAEPVRSVHPDRGRVGDVAPARRRRLPATARTFDLPALDRGG